MFELIVQQNKHKAYLIEFENITPLILDKFNVFRSEKQRGKESLTGVYGFLSVGIWTIRLTLLAIFQHI